ncbi:TetR/AcrR family transcriptional regulator [uncultured Roseobacter sp.]|uniref:TetR/AcrR family transcriptional regulator n=1 Tax=uncultured Roseobacter sp. TaxID=114847 RepID=UPI002618FE92|nr:TetR/AcrR family transcriptional regulator [uncultured Roseobacter sp.]
MARPREFDTDEAIRKAADVFWAKGYEDASLPDLLEGMGLTRGSLYKAFQDKKSLYLRVLDHYETVAVDKAVRRLTDISVPDGRRRVLGLFKGVVQAVSDGDRRGCLLCTAAAGNEMSDPEIAAAVNNGLRRIRDALAVALSASPLHDTMQPDARATLANVLLTQYIGLRVLARSCLPLGIVEQSGRGIEELLRAR